MVESEIFLKGDVSFSEVQASFRGSKVLMNSVITSTRNKYRGALLKYLIGLSPKDPVKGFSNFFVFLNRAEVRDLLTYLSLIHI